MFYRMCLAEMSGLPGARCRWMGGGCHFFMRGTLGPSCGRTTTGVLLSELGTGGSGPAGGTFL
eukprot:282901-Pyramimonas_sp.AAC.1